MSRGSAQTRWPQTTFENTAFTFPSHWRRIPHENCEALFSEYNTGAYCLLSDYIYMTYFIAISVYTYTNNHCIYSAKTKCWLYFYFNPTMPVYYPFPLFLFQVLQFLTKSHRTLLAEDSKNLYDLPFRWSHSD